MDISIARLNAHDREVLAIHQAADPKTVRRGAYILCRPIGQEGARTVAMYRVLSERLARAGCEVWRFDYHGTGDAPGEEAHQTLHGWVQDVLTVHGHAMAKATGPVQWFGMSLGATVALQAAVQAANRPKGLVLWEPVFNGSDYTQALLAGHRRELAREFGCSWAQLLHQRRVSEPALPGDVLGFDFGEHLSKQLLELNGLPLASVLRRGVQVVVAVHDDQKGRIEPGVKSPDLRIHAIQTRTDWMSSQAMGTAIVPPDAIQTLMDTLS